MTQRQPIHPGAVLKSDFLGALKITSAQLATAIDVSPRRISAIIRGERAISTDTALRLGRYFGTSAHFWRDLQTRYELALAEESDSAVLAAIAPLQRVKRITQSVTSDIADLRAVIDQKRVSVDHPIVVGVSGYAGSGKSTLVRRLVDADPAMVRLRGDDFLDPTRSHHRSVNWDGVERTRLVDEVLAPFRQGHPSTFRRFDWDRRELGQPEPIPTGDVLLVDLIGLFHAEALHALDVKIWVDVPLEIARQRGMKRDESLGREHSALWYEVWIPNETDFELNFAPRDHADIIYDAFSTP